MPDKRNGPGGDPEPAPESFGGDGPILDDGTDFDLVTCTPGEFLAWLSGYRSGIWQGSAAEIARREAEDRAVYLMAVQTVHAAANLPTHDELEDARRRRTFEAAARWAASDEAVGQ